MARREVEEINAGSMADIAFLLLIFFLVTTTMDQDIGIPRMLPPPPDPNQEITKVIKLERNVFEVLANREDRLLVKKKDAKIEDLKRMATEFYTNPRNSDELPTQVVISTAGCNGKIGEFKNRLTKATDTDERASINNKIRKWKARRDAAELLGGSYITVNENAIISLRNDKGTSYQLYTQVQNELQAAVNDLRNELCMEKFGVPFSELDKTVVEDFEKIKAIRLARPQRITELNPRK